MTKGRTRRVVAIGDLNGASGTLEAILRGVELIDRRMRWRGGRARLVHMGDVLNRGNGGRRALELLRDLRIQAERTGGEVTTLLGNHETMMALGDERYSTVGEYLSFATSREQDTWPRRVERAYRRIAFDIPPDGPAPPVAPRLEMWKFENAPGKRPMRRTLGPRGQLGREIRRLPVAIRIDDIVFVHAGLTPRWARLGIEGLNEAAESAWRDAPDRYFELSRRSILRASDGPLWSRRFALETGRRTEKSLTRSLQLLGAKRMVIGHTRTEYIPRGQRGRITTRFRRRLVCIDVGLEDVPHTPRTALIIDGGIGWEWTPAGRRVLWRDRGR